MPISACVVACDEADRVEACLRSLAWCDEVLVVDSHSTDATREIARAAGARVIERDWPGHAAQKEFAVRAARNEWVLCIDADERLSADLQAEVQELAASGFPGAVGWSVPRVSAYLGRWIRHGTWYPDRSVRLFDRRRGRFVSNPRYDLHERVVLDGPCGTLRSDLLHLPYRSLSDHLRTIDRYTTIMAEGMSQRGKRARVRDIVLRPCGHFFKFFILRAGFLDGWRGLLLAYLDAHYARLKYAKLLALERGGGEPPPPHPARAGIGKQLGGAR